MNNEELAKIASALRTGLDLAIAQAEETHIKLAGYKPERHKAVDCELAEMREALAIAECIIPFERATEAGTPATAGTPLRWRRCRDTGHIVQDDEGDYVLHEDSERHASARAEEARREGHQQGWKQGRAAGQMTAEVRALAAAQRTAGGDAVATVIKKGAERHWMSERLGSLPDGTYSLYLAAQPVEEAAAQAACPGCDDPAPALPADSSGMCSACIDFAAAPTAQPTPRIISHEEDGMGGSRTVMAYALAQPTPPDDELPSAEEFFRDQLSASGMQNYEAGKLISLRADVWCEILGDYARAALRHPPVPNVGGNAAEARELWKAALADAAMYVEAHCVDGERHARHIMEQPMPKIRTIGAAPNPADEDAAKGGAA